MALRSWWSEIKRWALPQAPRRNPCRAPFARARLGGEALEARTLFTVSAAAAWSDAADPAPAGEFEALVLSAQATGQADGVVLETFGDDQAIVGDPAPPPETPTKGLQLEKPFLHGTLVVSQFMANRVSITYYPAGGLSSVSYNKGSSFYDYVDTPDLLTLYTSPQRERGARTEIDFAAGTFRQFKYSGDSSTLLTVSDVVFDTKYSRAESGMEQQFDLSRGEPRLVQRISPIDRMISNIRIEHFAEDGSTLVYEKSRFGVTTQVRLADSEQQFDFAGESLLQGGSGLTYGVIKLAHLNAAGLKEFVSFTLSPHTIVSRTVLEDTILGAQPFGFGRAEIYEHRELESNEFELRARIIAPSSIPGQNDLEIVFPRVQTQTTNEAGALVIRGLGSTRTFLPSGELEQLHTAGDTYKKQTSRLRSEGSRISLDLVREEWGTLVDGSLRRTQLRLRTETDGEPWAVYARFEHGTTQFVWAQPLLTAKPSLLAYWTDAGPQLIELITYESPEFDENNLLHRLIGVERYEDDLRQVNVEVTFENGLPHVSVESAPRPLEIRTAFGDGELIAEKRSDGLRFLYLFDSAGQTLLERQVVSFKNGASGIEIDDGQGGFVVHPDGRINVRSTALAGSEQLIIDETRRFIAHGAGYELLPTERQWLLRWQPVQTETFTYTATGELLSTHLSRNPGELLEPGESPAATFELTLPAHDDSSLFLYQSRTGQLRNTAARRISFVEPPELTRAANGLVDVVRGYEKSLAGGEQLIELSFSQGQTRLSEQVLFETVFGDAGDNRLGIASVLQTVDRQGERRSILRLSGLPWLTDRAHWHPFDLFFAAQPLVEYEIAGWRSAGAKLIATRTDGTELTLSADEQSPLVDEVRRLDTGWGPLTIATTYRPLYGISLGAEFTLAPVAREIRGGDGRVWQSERIEYQPLVIREPVILSHQIEWRLPDGRQVEYRQQGDAHVLKIADSGDPRAAKIYRFLEAPVLNRRNDASLVIGIFGRVAGPLGDESFVLPLF